MVIYTPNVVASTATKRGVVMRAGALIIRVGGMKIR